eukprot:2855854-Alexandrium_andersonii.AAC.1
MVVSRRDGHIGAHGALQPVLPMVVLSLQHLALDATFSLFSSRLARGLLCRTCGATHRDELI